MNHSPHILSQIRLVLVSLGIGLLCGCSTVNAKREGALVRKADFETTPQRRVLADQAQQICDRRYPQVCDFLKTGDVHFPRRFEICLRPSLKNGNIAEVRAGRIYLNGKHLDAFLSEPSYLEEVLIHEMVHVAQRYGGYSLPFLGRWVAFGPNRPACWAEGMADYMRFKLSPTNVSRCAKCRFVYPHFRDGYSCAGAFLLYLEQNYRFDIVPQLHAALRKGKFQEGFFLAMTGKDLWTLWAEFQTTDAFTPEADQMLKLQDELGFKDGIPPKDIDPRLREFLDQRVDARMKRMIENTEFPGSRSRKLQSRLATFCYFTQPGGTAEAYLVGLQESHRLPGFTSGEHGMLKGLLRDKDFEVNFPTFRTFTATKLGDDSVYHYTLGRATRDSSWRLDRAWRTTPDGVTLEEYPLP